MSDLSACMVNNQFIYLIHGDLEADIDDDIEMYSISDNSWQTIQIMGEMPPRVLAFSYQIGLEEILIAGGFEGSGGL